MTITPGPPGTPRARSPGTWIVLLAEIADWGRTLRLCAILACANAPLILSAWLTSRR